MKRALPVLLLLLITTYGCTATRLSSTSDETGFREFLETWEEAQIRFVNGDPTLWKENSSHEADSTILGAFGGQGEKGWEAVNARYDWASSRYRNRGATVEVEYLNIGVSGDLAFTVAIERQKGTQVGDRPPADRTLRATQIFRRENGSWKLLHRQGDAVVEKLVQ